MGFCSRECSFMTVCALQLIATLERLAFDFVGYMFVPILGGFLNIIFILFGIFGTHQYRPRLLMVYCIWTVIWLGWNVFLIFLYLEVGSLSLEKHSGVLDFGTGGESWWVENGIGCNATFNVTTYPTGQVKETRISIEGCLLNYKYVETIQASVHIILCVVGLIAAIFVFAKLYEEEETSIIVSDNGSGHVLPSDFTYINKNMSLSSIDRRDSYNDDTPQEMCTAGESENTSGLPEVTVLFDLKA